MILRYRNIRSRQQYEITAGLRDAQQNGAEKISDEKETRSPARSSAARRVFVSLRNGDIHPDAVCHGSQTRWFPRSHRLRQSLRRWRPGFPTVDGIVPAYRRLSGGLNSPFSIRRTVGAVELACLNEPPA